jgi:hypothetical protein
MTLLLLALAAAVLSAAVLFTPAALDQLLASLAALGFVAAATCAVLYFMQLSIFAKAALEWLFVYSLAALALAVLALVLRQIWQQPGGARY